MKKTALEHFEDIKELEVADERGGNVEDILPYKCEQVEKSLKALEIIKEKDVDVSWLKYCIKENMIVEAYNSGYPEYHKHLTEEEFETLKEVLGEWNT